MKFDLIHPWRDRGVGWRGRRGERLAAKILRKKRYKILGRNLRARFGEIDILARDGQGTIVVVEVKTGTPGQDMPELRVDPAKQRKIAMLSSHLARRYGLADRRFRFDVIAVEIPDVGRPTIRHHPGAFESPV